MYLPIKLQLEEEIGIQNLQKGPYHSFDVNKDHQALFLFRRVFRKRVHNAVILRESAREKREITLPRDLHRYDLKLVRWWSDREFLLLQPHAGRETAPNAFVLDLDGCITHQLAFGNAVSDVAVSPKGLFWVLYREEAVNTEGAMGEKLCRGITINSNTLYFYRDYDKANDRFFPDAIFDGGGVCVDAKGRIWVGGFGGGPPIIAVLDHEGNLLERRSLQGQTGEINNIAADRLGGCFITNFRQKIYYLEKGFLTPQQIVVEDTHRGRFTHPGEMRITPDDILYVGDNVRNLVGVFRIKPKLSVTQSF